MDDYELGWAVGFFEGEGCIYVQRHPKGRNILVSLQLVSTDHDRLLEFQRIVRAGNIRELTVRDNCKRAWHWQVRGADDVERIITILYDGLGPRRQAKADEVLAILEHSIRRTSRLVMGGECRKGHVLSFETVMAPPSKGGRLTCKACVNERERGYRCKQ